MDATLQAEFRALEARVRMSTALILALVAFGCTYGLLLVTHRLVSPGLLFYPWLAGGLFYLAGELLGLIWFRVITHQLLALQAAARREARNATTGNAGGNGVQLDAHQSVQDIEVVQA